MVFFQRNNLPRITDGDYVINIDKKQSKLRHCILLFIVGNTALYFGSFRIEYIYLRSIK